MENNIDQSLFNEKSLYLLNIRELRVLGRKYGVPSPTTKTKKELVDYILNVIYGKVEVPIRNIYGRHPNTKEFNMDGFLDKLKTNSDVMDKYDLQNDEMFAIKLASPSSNYDLEEYNTISKIYSFENNKHFLKSMAFVKSDSDIEITSEMAQKYNLENLDIVDILLVDDLLKIYSKNGIKIEDKFQNIAVLNCQIKKGLKRDFFFESDSELEKETQSLIKSAEKNGLKTLIFTKNDYENKNLQSVKYFEDEDKTQIYKKIINFANLCEMNIKNGEEIVVIIENYDSIKNLFLDFDKDVYVKIENYLSNIFDKITKLENAVLFFNKEVDIKY